MKSISIGSILIIVFAVWIMLGTGGMQRIDRACRPVLWVGNVAVSLTSLTSDEYAAEVQHAFNKGDYGCRFTLWRLFYEDEYLQAIKDGKIQPRNQREQAIAEKANNAK